MKKLFKLLIGIIACSILFLYLVLPLVKIEGENYHLVEYLKYIFDNISATFKNLDFTQVDMLWNVVVWLLMLVIITSPIGCLVVVALKGITSGLLTKRNLTVISLELLSFAFSAFLIGICYYLLNKYSLSSDANQLQIAMVKIACTHIWEPTLYISAFGSLLLSGLTIYTNSIKKKMPKEEAE